MKGEDLLFLDKPNLRLDDDLVAEYARLGLPAGPFDSVRFFAPPTPGDPTGRPHVSGRTSGVDAFWWSLSEFCRDELLPYVFADAEDDRNQYTIVIHQVAARLRQVAQPFGAAGAVSIDGTPIHTYADLVEFVADRLQDDATRAQWAGAATTAGSINAFLRRLRSSLRALGSIIRGDIGATEASRRISTASSRVTVVDLHNLPERAQRFVVGVVLAAETAAKERAGAGNLLFTMLDELNKYAPREGNSPIKDVLLDIAERGRSLGIILIGAQQTASEVERRIVSNSSIRVVGRLDPAEAGTSRVRLPAGLPASARDPRQAGRDVRLPAGDPGAAGSGVPVPRLGDPAVGMRARAFPDHQSVVPARRQRRSRTLLREHL